jgi:hypothetical protein
MPREITGRFIDLKSLEVHQALSEGLKWDKFSLPKNPILLESVVRALVQRLKKIDEGHYKHLVPLLNHLANLDQFTIPSTGSEVNLPEWVNIVNQIAAQLADPRLPKGHWEGTLRLQHDSIIKYMLDNNFPWEARNFLLKVEWLEKNLSSLIVKLKHDSCWCNYESFSVAQCLEYVKNGRTDPKAKKVTYYKSPKDFTYLILSELHSTTRAYLEKLLH